MEGRDRSIIRPAQGIPSALFWKLQVMILVVLLTISSSGAQTHEQGHEDSPLGNIGPLSGEGPNPSLAQNISVEICTWKDNKSAAVSLTFDDGKASQVDYAAPLMHERGLNGTFFNTLKHVGIPAGAEWWEWNNVSLMGHEVTSHTWNHSILTTVDAQTLWEEVVNSKIYIQENISTASSETFCYPGGYYNDTVVDLVKEHYIGARAVPLGSPTPVNSSPPDLYTVIPVNFGTTESVEDMNQLVEDAVSEKGWLVEMLHEIGDSGFDPVPVANFTAHLDYLVEREDAIWVAPYVNVIKYIRERDGADPVITLLSDYSFTVFLNSTLDPSIYSENLTLNISLPLDWTEVLVSMGNVSRIVTPMIAGENRYFLADSHLNETLTVTRTAPVLGFIEAAPGANSSFFPEGGDLDTVFTFRVNYSSPLNLSPVVECLLDLNGDGDMLDVFGSMSEGAYLMERLDTTDVDYTDGCVYQFNTSFPLGSSPWFAFSAEDNEGRPAFDPDNLTTLRPGPYIANFTTLKEGWNLVSIPLFQQDTDLDSVLSPIQGHYDAVQWYDGDDISDPWKHEHTSKPTQLNDLDGIDHKRGFWIHVTEPGGVTFNYTGAVHTENQTIPLYTGWNLVGYPSLANHNRTVGLNNLSFDDQVDAIWTYNAGTQKWKKLIESDHFEIGNGYFVHAKEECTWEIPL